MGPGGTLTYAELDAAANRMAHALLARTGAGAAPVALLFGGGVDFAIASIGALKAGAIQVPLDCDSPRARLAFMLEHSGARLLVTAPEHAALARDLAGSRCEILDAGSVHAQPASAPGLAVAPDALASINYTSGSTGAPKGVVHSHRAVLVNVMRHDQVFRLGREDRHAFLRPAMVPLLFTLLGGAACCPIELDRGDLTRLADQVVVGGVTVFRGPVSTLRILLDGVRGDESFPDLRLVIATGEPAYPADVERCRRHFGAECVFATSIGTRETGDYAYFFADRATPLPTGALPGGYAADDVDVLLLDEDGRLVHDGEVGELAVRCGSAPVGYWERPDLTEAALLPDPEGGDLRVYRTGDLGRRLPDGSLLHVGRRDFQVKVRGYRVDVGDVEHALLAVPGIRQAVVAGREEPGGGQRLVGYVVPEAGDAPSVPAIRGHLAAALPDYMVPTAFVVLAELPQTATGKIDRRALPPPARVRPDLGAPPVAPRGPLEAMLAEIWADALGLDAVGIHDGFLDLGGDSLRANQIVSRVLTRLALPLEPSALFLARTIADMAATILVAGLDGPARGGLEPGLEPGEAPGAR